MLLAQRGGGRRLKNASELLLLSRQWKVEDWFQAETLCRSVWSSQHSIRAVVVQFALFHRALLEREALATSNNNNGKEQSDFQSQNPSEWIGLSLLNRMLSNWRLVYIGGRALELTEDCHLSPQNLLATIVSHYHDRFFLGLSEWTMFMLLDADVCQWRPETPQFSQEILDTAVEMYQAGERRCKPKAQLFNCILQSWIPANDDNSNTKSNSTTNTAAVAAVGEVFECMKELGIPPNGRTYKFALRLWSQQRTHEAALEAENLLQRMYADFLDGVQATQPDVYAFNLVVVAWYRSGSADAGPRCEEIFRQMELLRGKGHLFGFADISIINNTIQAYAQAGNVQALQRSEQFWRSTGVPGNNITYVSLIKQAARLGRIDDVERLIREKTALSSEPPSDLSTYVLVFKAYAESKLVNKAIHANDLLQHLEQDAKIKLNTIVYNGVCFYEFWCFWKAC